MKSIRIATVGCPSDYASGLFPIIAQSLGYKLEWTNPNKAHLVILGPFFKPNAKKLKWCPKPLRNTVDSALKLLQAYYLLPIVMLYFCCLDLVHGS